MKRKRLDGTVLILVVAFMLILIVFCMATLAMVSTANRRALTKFEENQSFYTAASALEVFKDGMLSDPTYYAYTTTGGTTPRTYYDSAGAPITKLSQGRALELDLYKLAVLKDTTATGDPLKGGGKNGTDYDFFSSPYDALNLVINAYDSSDGGQKFFTDPSAPQANYAKQFMVKDPTSVANAFRYAEYTMNLPGISTSSVSGSSDDIRDYGLFADPVGTGTSATYPAKITVEVIERYYNMAGIKIDDLKKFMDGVLDSDSSTPTAAEAAAVSAIFNPSTYVPGSPTTYVPDTGLVEAAIRGGERHKDYFRIRVTAESTLLGVKSETAREFVIYEVPDDDFDNSNTSTGPLGNGDDNVAMTMTGGAAAMGNLNMVVPDQTGSFYTERDYYIAESGTTNLAGGEYVFAKGHIILGNAGANAIRANDFGAFVYAGMGIYAASTTGIGGDEYGNAVGGGKPLTVITGGSFDFSTVIGIYGNLIAHDMRYYNDSGKLNVSGDIYLDTYHPLPVTDDDVAVGLEFSVSDYGTYYSGFTVNGSNITVGGDFYVEDAIYLPYEVVDDDSDGTTAHYLTMGGTPFKVRSSARVYDVDSFGATRYISTAGQLSSMYTNTYGYELPSYVTIDDVTPYNIDVQYFEYTKQQIPGQPEMIQFFLNDPSGARRLPNPPTDVIYTDYDLFTKENGATVREIELPSDMPGTSVDTLYLPTTQGKYNQVLNDGYFVSNGNLGKFVINPVTGASELVDAWDWNLALTSNTSLDIDTTATAAYRISGWYYDEFGIAFTGTSGGRHFPVAYGAYTDGLVPPPAPTVVDDAKLSTEQVYVMNKFDKTEAELSTVLASEFTINRYSAPAPITANGKAAYTYSGTNGGTAYTCSMPAGDVITGSGTINVSGDTWGNKVYYIDATSEDIELQFTGNIYGKFIILGQKQVNFLVPEGQGTIEMGGSASGYVDVFIMRDKLYAMINSGQTLSVGEDSAFEPVSIGKTYMYIGNGTNAEYRGTNSIIGAIVFSLKSTFTNQTSSGTSVKVDYNGITETKTYCTFGTVMSSEYKRQAPGGGSSASPTGNCQMPPGAPPEDGAPNFDWNNTRYLASVE
ncbi:MAG: hypothetical protein LBL80_03250 [Ruminococcus sp.]|jgi:hypothetical protein|nr:hypothetical protein [Ruminococcus sp.]